MFGATGAAAGSSMSSSRRSDIKAFILCGYGSDCYPLIDHDHSNADSTTASAPSSALTAMAASAALVGSKQQIKPLLPVASKRMIDWVIDQVEEAGVQDILVFSPTSISHQLSAHLKTRRTSAAVTKVELQEVDENLARRGTVAIIQWAIQSLLIKSDFILLPCDLLLSPSGSTPVISLSTLLDRHRTDDNLMTTLFYERSAGSVVRAAKDGPSEILTIYDSKTSTLLDVCEMDEFDEDEVPLRSSLLSKFPAPTLTTTLLPTQLYLFSSALLPLLVAPRNARRIRSWENFHQVARWVSRLAWRSRTARSSGRTTGTIDSDDEQEDEEEESMASRRSTTQFPSTSSSSDAAQEQRWGESSISYELRGDDLHYGMGAGEGEERKRGARRKGGRGGCKIVIWRKEDGWCGRGNTVAGWVEMNRAALKLLPPLVSSATFPLPAGVFISPDSWVPHSVYHALGEKVGIKRSILGRGCIVGKGSKLTGVIAMEGVVVGEGVKLENCVLSNGVQIRDRAVLKDCELGRDVIIEADASIKNEQLVVELD